MSNSKGNDLEMHDDQVHTVKFSAEGITTENDQEVSEYAKRFTSRCRGNAANSETLNNTLKQLDLYEDGAFDCADPEVAVVRPDNGAWVDANALQESSFRWRDLVVKLMPMVNPAADGDRAKASADPRRFT